MTISRRRKIKSTRTRLNGYSPAKAANFWNRRLQSTNPLAAVLTYNAHPSINEAYDRWERLALDKILDRSLRRTKAVDLGAGTGRISLMLAERHAEVISIDTADLMLGHLLRAAQRRNLHKAITPILASATNLPLADTCADLITCCGLLEHLPSAARNSTLREAFRVLAPSGKLIVVVNNTDSAFLKHQYPLTAQRDDGYFVGLVGLSWLTSAAQKAGKVARVRTANPWYACASALISSGQGSDPARSAAIALLGGLPELDILADPSSPTVRLLATHYIVEVTQR